MIINEVKDINVIRDILYHDGIREYVGGDLIPKEDFNPQGEILWLGGYVKGEIIGLVAYNTYEGKVYCHIQTLPEHRQHTIQFMRMALTIGKVKNASIYAEVSKDRPEIIKFAKAFNFKTLEETKDTLLLRLKTCQLLHN